jgi:hypothetical protein
MIEGAGLEVPDLVGVVEEAVAHQLSLGRRQPDQVHLLGHTQFEIEIKPRAICFDQMNRSRNRSGGQLEPMDAGQTCLRKIRTSFSSLRLSVPARKVVEPASARTSAMHRACKQVWPKVRRRKKNRVPEEGRGSLPGT